MDDSQVARLAAEGAAAWPGIPGAIEEFAAFLGARGAGALDAGRAGDLFLAWSCGRGEPAALAAFDERYGRQLAAIAMRAGLAPDVIEEALQTIRVRLLVGEAGAAPRITQYLGRSDLASWLKVAVLRQAYLIARQARAGDPEDLELLAAPEIDAEARLFADRYRDAFRTAFAEALAGLERDERALLRYRYLDGLTEAQAAQLLGVHRVTVARRVAAARGRLLAETRDRLRAQLDLPTADLDSIMRAAHSQLGITLRRVFASRPDTGGR